MVHHAQGVGGAAKPNERLPFTVHTLKINTTPRGVAQSRTRGVLRHGEGPGRQAIAHRVISEEDDEVSRDRKSVV